jgi:hypothetical protein
MYIVVVRLVVCKIFYLRMHTMVSNSGFEKWGRLVKKFVCISFLVLLRVVQQHATDCWLGSLVGLFRNRIGCEWFSTIFLPNKTIIHHDVNILSFGWYTTFHLADHLSFGWTPWQSRFYTRDLYAADWRKPWRTTQTGALSSRYFRKSVSRALHADRQCRQEQVLRCSAQ